MSLVASHHNDPGGAFAAIPLLMRNAPRWLVWKAVPSSDPGKKRRKVPYYPNGSPRHGQLDGQEDLARFGSLADALAAYQSGGYAGLGFALGPDGTGNHWQGADFDGAHFAELVASLPGYRERSPSGQGFHAIGYGRSFASLGANGSGVEAYAGGRFFTVTGQGLGGELTCLADAVERRLRTLHSPAAATPAEPPSARPEPPSAAVVPMDQTAADLRSALTTLSPDGYDLWYRMGLALKCLGDAGLGLWLEWSAGSAKFDQREALAKWATFQPSATGFRAVFAEAQRQGWQNPNRHPNADIPIVDAVAARTFTTGGQSWSFSFGTKAELVATTALAFPAVSLNEWLSARPSPTPIVPGHFYADVGVFVAPGGTGKTTSVLWQAVHIALGRDLWGMPVLRPGPVMILTAEDSRELLVARLRLICGELGLTDEQTQLVAERVRIGDVSGSGFRLTQVERDVVRPAEAALSQLIDAAKAIGPVLLVIDPAVSFGVVCACLSVASMLSALFRFIPPGRWIVHWTTLAQQSGKVRAYIPHMTDHEREIVGYLLHHNQKSFTAASDGGYAATLISRGIVVQALRPGQMFSLEDVPFAVPDHVWKVLEKHRDQFPKPKADAAYPWRVHWMAR